MGIKFKIYEYQEELFWEDLRCINILNNSYAQWQTKTARKEHTDINDIKILPGEIYISRNAGNAYDQVIKMSIQSMEKFLYSVFSYNYTLRKLCTIMLKTEENKMIMHLNELNKTITEDGSTN